MIQSQLPNKNIGQEKKGYLSFLVGRLELNLHITLEAQSSIPTHPSKTLTSLKKKKGALWSIYSNLVHCLNPSEIWKVIFFYKEESVSNNAK